MKNTFFIENEKPAKGEARYEYSKHGYDNNNQLCKPSNKLSQYIQINNSEGLNGENHTGC
jgi:hypothetical protein